MSCYKMLPIRRCKPPKAEYTMKINTRRIRVKSKPPWLMARPLRAEKTQCFGLAEGSLQIAPNSKE
jgi:hypothetical protein